ncbi:hypothetical protein Dimus_015078 [Dionaea muscipula]
MAATYARRTLQTSPPSATRAAISNIGNSISSSKASQSLGASLLLGSSFRRPSTSRFSLLRLFNSSRVPVELASAQSMMPLHSVTASSLYTSLLSLHSGNWGFLSEEAVILRTIFNI